ncbi:MAG: translation initiation factor IF-2 [Clostridia bacterium]|nr:MAG: translation initiation factor IF-2 [Clostridia bacterium]
MAKTRVYEVAKDLGLSTKEMLALLHNVGISVKSHMSILEEAQIDEVRKRVAPVTDQGRAVPVEAAKPGGSAAPAAAGPPREKPGAGQAAAGRPAMETGGQGPGGQGARPAQPREGRGPGHAAAGAVPAPARQEQRPAGSPPVRGTGAGAAGYGREGAAPSREAGSHGSGRAGADRGSVAHEQTRGGQSQPGQGRPGYGGGQSQPGQGRPGYGGGQSQPGQGRPGYGGGQSQPGQGRPGYGGGQSQPGQGRPGYGGGQSQPGQGRPGYGGGQSQPGQGRPGYGGGQSQPGQGRPGYGGGQSRPGQGRPGYGGGQSQPGQGRPGYGGGQSRPGQGRPLTAAQPGRAATAPAPAKGMGGQNRPGKGTGRPGKDGYGRNRPGEAAKAKSQDFHSGDYRGEEEWAGAVARRPLSKNKKRRGQGALPGVPQPVVKKIVIGETVTVQDLAQKLAKSGAEVVKKLVAIGVMASLTQEIDADTATLVANEYGTQVEVRIDRPTELEDLPDARESLLERPPVVTVMGHVDHGKTSLLDAIRQTNVTATEAGGITQHIGAYQVQVGDRKITFLDTPGHEAFTAMRARGAEVTDIAVLVVAADDGVMPQTVEAINHARAAGVPIIVAVNKIDRPDANADRVKQQLTEHGLVSEEWGGDAVFVNVSATKRIGIDELLEMILLVAEMGELKANPDRPARGTVIEAELDRGRGPVATVLVQKGTLRVGDSLVAGAVAGKVRAMFDFRGERLEEAGPSTPVQVLGLDDVPEAGDIVQVTSDEKVAREVSLARQDVRRKETLAKNKVVSLDEFFKNIKASETKELPLIVKADVQGSLEAVIQALSRLGTDEVKVTVIHGGVGAVTETDVMLASASGAIIIGFNVRADAGARKAAEAEKIDIRLYLIIYELIDDVRKAMSGLLEPEEREVILGRAEVRQTFRVPRVGAVAGSYVTEGKVLNHARVRVIRDGVVVYQGQVHSLKRFKDDVREVVQGYECGIGVENFNDVKEGDVLEAYTIEKIKREL